MFGEPQEEHRWLQKLVGEWTFVTEALGGPGEPSSKSEGREVVTSLGDLWVICHGQGVMPDGGPAKTIMTLGYDPVKSRFIGTWVGSMMTHMWLYEGELDLESQTLPLNTEGPDFKTPGATARYQDIVTMKSDDLRTLTSRTLGDDGQWHEFMKAEYRRVR